MRSLYEFDAMIKPSEKEAKLRGNKESYSLIVYVAATSEEDAQTQVESYESASFTGKVTPLAKDWQ